MLQLSKLIYFTLFLLVSKNIYSQSPTLLNYPLIKGYYKTAKIENNSLFCLTDYGLMIWDITDISSPNLISKIAAPGIYYNGEIEISGNNIFIQRFDTIIVIDKTVISNPIYANFDIPINFINDIAIKDSILFVGSNNFNGLTVYNISDLNNPIMISNLPIIGIEKLTINDTILTAYNSNCFYRFKINSGLPIVLDSIVMENNRSILSAVSNNETTVIALGDNSNFSQIIGNFVYDISTPGNYLLLDSTSIKINGFKSLLLMSDTILISHNDSIVLYNITDPSNITSTDSFSIEHFAPVFIKKDSLLIAMSGSNGFEIHKKISPFNYEIHKKMKVGEWFSNLQISSNGLVFVRGNDSVYVFNKSRSTSETISDFKFISLSGELKILDSFLIETGLNGPSSITISGFNNLPTLDSFCTVYGIGTSSTENIRIWNQKLYNYSSPGTEIYDFTNPNNPILLISGIPIRFEVSYNDILYKDDGNLNDIELYDATTVPPILIKQVTSSLPGCGGGAIWDEQRAMRHFLGVTSGCFFQLDLTDTSNIQYSISKPLLGLTGVDVSKAKTKDSILYLPGVSGYNLHIFDVCDIEHFRKIIEFKLNGFVTSLALVDNFLFISYGGYIEKYDVSNLIPCLFLNDIKNEDSFENYFTCYPNPSNGYLTLNYFSKDDKVDVSIINSIGQKSYNFKLKTNPFSNNIEQLSMNLPSGIYIIAITGEKTNLLNKIIIE